MGLSAGTTEMRAVSRPKALADLMVLDTPAEQAFDDLVFVAAKACGVPIALITLLDADRQWFKAVYGLDVQKRRSSTLYAGSRSIVQRCWRSRT